MRRNPFGTSINARSRLVYLVCTAGFPNYGDEIILRRMLSYLNHFEPNCRVWVDCPNPGNAAILMQGVNRNAQFTDTLYRLCWISDQLPVAEIANNVVAAIDNPGRTPRWVSGIELLKRADIIHILGGGYLNDVWPFHIGIPAAVGHVARTTQAKAAMTGCGLLPHSPDTEGTWKRALEAFDVVTVRDNGSLEFCREIGAQHARREPDSVHLGGISKLLDKHAASAPTGMVCVQQDLTKIDFHHLVDFVRDVLNSWQLPSHEIGFVECIPGADRLIFAELQPEFPDAHFFTFWDIMRNGFPAAKHQQWISTRFHPHLLAAAAGASGIAVNVNNDFYGVKHQAVREDGSEWVIARPEKSDTLPIPGGPGILPSLCEQYQEATLATAMSIYR